MKRLLVAALLSGALIPSQSLAQLCQVCVSEYWSCRWDAKSTRTSCLSAASSQSEKDQCWKDYDRDILYCQLQYNWCQDHCEASRPPSDPPGNDGPPNR